MGIFSETASSSSIDMIGAAGQDKWNSPWRTKGGYSMGDLISYGWSRAVGCMFETGDDWVASIRKSGFRNSRDR